VVKKAKFYYGQLYSIAVVLIQLFGATKHIIYKKYLPVYPKNFTYAALNGQN